MQCCWFSSSFQSILWCIARRHCRNVTDCLGSSTVLLWSVQLPGKSMLRCLRENGVHVSSWMKQRRWWQRWMRRRGKYARHKEKHGWVTSDWEKEVGDEWGRSVHKWKGCTPTSSTVYLSLVECKGEAAAECRDGASPCQREKAQSSWAIGTMCAPRLACSWFALKQKQIVLQP